MFFLIYADFKLEGKKEIFPKLIDNSKVKKATSSKSLNKTNTSTLPDKIEKNTPLFNKALEKQKQRSMKLDLGNEFSEELYYEKSTIPRHSQKATGENFFDQQKRRILNEEASVQRGNQYR